MTIASASVAIGATFAPSGGSATSLLTKSSEGTQHIVYLDDGSDLIDQETYDFSYKAPKSSASAPGGYTAARNTVVIKVPLDLADGSSYVDTVRIEIACAQERTAAQKLSLRERAMHILNDADFTSFWDDQSKA
jgi:hypothetical protein